MTMSVDWDVKHQTKQTLTMSHDCPVPVGKHNTDKNFTPPPDPLGGLKGQIFIFCSNFKSFVNILTEIVHAIDMKHIKWDFCLKARVRPPWWT